MKGACGSSIQKLHNFKEIRYALKEKKVLKNLVHKRKACSYQTRPPACRTFKRKKSLQAEKFHPPRPGQPSSSLSGRVGEAAAAGLTSILAAGAGGVGQAAQNFGFRNATRAANAVEQRVFPQIIGRPTDAQRVIEQAGQRAQEIQRAAAQDIEQFVAEQAAAETADITPLLAETGAAAGEAAGVGALQVLGGAVGAVVAPEVAIPAAIGLAAGAGGALVAGVGRSEASTQTAPASGSRVAAIAGGAFEGARAGASAFPTARNLGRAGGAAVGGLGAATLGLGLGAVGGAYEGARYMLGGNAGDGSSSDQAPDIRTLNNMQQGAPQQQISLRQPRAQPRVQQPMVSRMDARVRRCTYGATAKPAQATSALKAHPEAFWSGRRVFASNASAQRERRKRQAKAAKASETGAILQRASAGSADPRSRACLTPLVGRTTNNTTRY